MAYTPTSWQTGDVVTSAKLNNIEQGIVAASGLVTVTIDEDTGVATLDKSYNDIVAMLASGVLPMFAMPGEGVFVAVSYGVVNPTGQYVRFGALEIVAGDTPQIVLEFTAATADAPLTANMGG